jgi:Ca-activated chloride channel family protein
MWGFGFQHPWLLLALLVVPVAVYGFFLLERKRAKRAAAWANPRLVPNMLSGDPGSQRLIPLVLFLIGLILLLSGFARPQAKVSEPRQGATVVLAVDVSGSMAAKDVKPSRLAAADAAITEFLKELPSKYRVALVTFSNRPSVRVPPTYDHQVLLQQLPTQVEIEGSAIGDGIKQALGVATTAVGKSRPGAPHPPAAIILLSDGNQNEGTTTPQQAAQEARKLDVPISTVSLGTQNGVVYQKTTGGYTEQFDVPVASSDLRTVAQTSGGHFYTARTASSLKQVYESLGSKIATSKMEREITQWWTMAALAFIVVGALLSGLWFRRLV